MSTQSYEGGFDAAFMYLFGMICICWWYLGFSVIQHSSINNNKKNLEVPGQRPPRPSRKYGTVQQPINTVLPIHATSGSSSAFLNVIDSKYHPRSSARPARKWSAPCLLGSLRKKRYIHIVIFVLTLIFFSHVI